MIAEVREGRAAGLDGRGGGGGMAHGASGVGVVSTSMLCWGQAPLRWREGEGNLEM